MHVSTDEVARRRAHMPVGVSSFLNTRSLAASHRRLAELLRPGLRVLDVGCGSGAITRGIAEAVGPDGQVVGLDINADLIAEAQRSHADVPGLSFVCADLAAYQPSQPFDIATAARVLQWLRDPLAVLRTMAGLVRPGGVVEILDYNHERVVWQPEPPASFRAFYAVFLRWRAEAAMDNAIADHLAAWFDQTGLQVVRVTAQHEHTTRDEPDFLTRTGMWADLLATRGRQVVADGFISEAERAQAEAEYRDWARESAQSQTLYLLAVEGQRA